MKNAILLILSFVLTSLGAPPKVNYPIRFGYINSINSWNSQGDILAGLGVPGFAQPHPYNYIALAFWSPRAPLDMAKVWDDPVQFIKPHPDLGSTKDQIQKSIKKKYNDAGIRLFISAFGATQMPTSSDPVTVATSLATWVNNNNLDGVDIDYQDNDAMTLSTGEQWLITFQKKLRQLLPNHLITHAPQAPYFSTVQYRKGGYITVDKQVGSTIDFYNVQFYNQGGTTYDSYETLFKKSNGWSTGTSVQEMINNGIPSEKIVVGKPATQADAANSGTVSTLQLGNWCLKAYEEFKWYAGVMFWQYRNDPSGSLMRNAANQLMTKIGTSINSNNSSLSSNSTSSNTTITNTTNATNSTQQSTTGNLTSNSSSGVILPSNQRVSYPIRLTYVNSLSGWWPASTIAAGLAVPGFAKNHTYNYVALAFWSYNGGVDAGKVWESPTMFMGTQSSLGKTNDEIRNSLKKAYNDNGVKVLISAFGATEMPTSRDPIDVATKLAKFVNDYNLDGCDIDYEDNEAMEAGKGEAWLIAFTRKLRQLLPSKIITHAPQAPYFKSEYYSKGGYVTVNKEVGNLIDFYNVQFYNQGDTKYNSYDELFLKATGFFSGTSVKEIINRGVPSNKIVVGKPAAQIDVMNSGLVFITDLGAWTSRAFSELGWYAGVMFWQFRSDTDGALMRTASSNLISQYQKQVPSTNTTVQPSSNTTNTSTTNTSNTNTSTINTTQPTNTTSRNTTSTNTSTNGSTNTSTNTSSNTSRNGSSVPVVPPSTSRVSYPVRLTYINFINSWWPATSIAAALGVPGYAKKHSYNYIVFAFWSDIGPLDIANVWAKPTYFLGTDSVFGTTDAAIRNSLKKLYNNAGIRVLVSAFGSTQMPTNKDPVQLASKLAKFVIDTNLDGCDIDYEDNDAMEAGKGEAWLIAFTRQLRQLLPNHTITHAPQAPYFKSQYYKNGGYSSVHKQVGNLIDFYNVQFYNQGDTKYNTYEELFIKASGFFSNTSVKEIIKRGVPSHKIVVGKPTAQIDVMNTGLVSLTDLGNWTSRAFKQLGWYAGVMLWQYRSDLSGTGILAATQALVTAYSTSGLPKSAPKLSIPESKTQNVIVPNNRVSYPVRFSWVNSLGSWSADNLLRSIGVPGIAKQTLYNYYSYTYWTYEHGATGAASFWNDPVSYLGTQSGFGSRKSQIQSNILRRFHSLNMKVMVTAFGPFEQPTTKGINPLVCARKLAKFVIMNNFDGVDINYEDDFAIASGRAELWLAVFSKQLRRFLPYSIISHSIKPAYFKDSDKGYNLVNKQVGDKIDFYNILYLQEESAAYNQYEEIFGSENSEDHWKGSIQQISQSGVPLYKLVAGKAIMRGDFSSSGWLKPQQLGQWGIRAFNQLGWYAGFAVWEYSRDTEGSGIMSAARDLIGKFSESQTSNK